MSSNPITPTIGGGGSAPGGSSGGGGGGGGPCGACKFLRRKCVGGCIFAPYFDSEQGAAHFAAVHKVFGASNVSKMLQHVPVHKRLDAVVTICYEAQSRLRNPVYGCVAHIFALQQQVVNLQVEISYLQAHLANLDQLQAPAVQPPAPPPHFSIPDLPTASTMPSTYDLSSLLFDQVVQWPPMHHHHLQPSGHVNNAAQDQYVTLAIPRPSPNIARSGAGASSSGGDVQGFASSELLLRHGSSGASAPTSGFSERPLSFTPKVIDE